GIATQYKYSFREEPLFPNELYMIKEIPFLLEMIGITKSIIILGIIIISFIVLGILYIRIIKPKKQNISKKNDYILRGLGLTISLGLLIYVSYFNFPDNKIKNTFNNYASWVKYNQTMNYDNNGFIAGFLSNLPAPAMHEPDEYSLAVIENIVNKYKKMSNEINQVKNNTNIDRNIIFVMNETCSDRFNLEGIEGNKDHR